MENHYNPHEEEEFGGIDARQQAIQFEQRLSEEQSFYMDVATLDEVYEYYRATDEMQKALQLLDFAIAQYPYNPEFFFKKSCLAYEQENYSEAYSLINQALHYNEADLQYAVQRAKALSALGHFDQAMQSLHDLMADAENEDVAEVRFQIGQLCQHNERYAEAIQYYTQVMQGGNDYEDALFEVVYCYEMLNDSEAGIAFCQRYVDDNPYSSTAWYNLGLLQHKIGQYEKAIFAYDYAVLIQEEFTSAYYGKASSLMELEQYDEAIRVCLQSLNHDRNDIGIMLMLGECYEEINDNSRARFYYGKCTEVYSGLPDAWYGIGSTFESEGRYLEGIHYYKKAIELNKDYFDAWLGLADCEYCLGNEFSAHEAFREAVRLYPQDTDMWRTWAERVLDDQGAEAAINFLAEGLQHNEGSVELLYQFAAYGLQAGRLREAMLYLENALLMDFGKHQLFLAYCPKALELPAIQNLIAQYKAEG